MDWARLLAYITGTVDQGLLLRNEYLATELRNEYLATENRILKLQLKGRLLHSDAERTSVAEIGPRRGRKAPEDVATAANPDTILRRYRRLAARKFDGSKSRRCPGRPRVDHELEVLVVRMAKENPGWGCDRIVGAVANLGYYLPGQTVGNILRRNGIVPAPERKHTTTWKAFIRVHLDVLAQLERLCGEMGEIGQGRVFVEADAVWRSLVETGTARIPRSLSRRAQSSRHEQRTAVPLRPGA